ncbi:MAG TPA: oligosaccharide flippase family protein [Chitinophagaceae bacterium]|nr:oligosaccharide flippase family protein [Chitinophagaceae bacterium]
MSKLSLNVVANLLGRAWPSLLSILFVPLYLKFMGIEAYGLIGFFATLQGVLGLLDLGIGSTMTRELARLSASEDSAARQRNLVRTLEVLYWLIAALSGVAVICVAPLIAGYWVKSQELNTELVVAAVRIMGIAVALQFPFSLYQGGLMGLQRQVLVNMVLAVVGTLRAGGSVLVLWLVSPSITSFMAWQVISGAVGSITCMILLWHSLPRYKERAVFSRSILKDVWKYAAAISANALIGVVLTQLDKVILSKMLSLKMFGYYSLASTVASAVWMLIIPLNNAVFPRFVQLYEHRNENELARLLHSSSQYLSLLMLPIAAVLSVFSREILLLWTHDAVVAENCRYIVTLLVIGTTINGMCSIPAYAASAFGWPQLITATNMLQAIIIVPLIVGLTYYWQGAGAALAWVAINCTYLFFMLPRFFRKYLVQERNNWYFRDELLPAALAFFIGMCSLALMRKNAFSMAPLLHLVATWAIVIVAVGSMLSHVRSTAKGKLCQFGELKAKKEYWL